MPTLTIELPEADYQAAILLSPAELRRAISDGVNNFATAKNGLEADEEPVLTPADLEAIGRGLADIEAGRTIPSDILFARLRDQARSGRK